MRNLLLGALLAFGVSLGATQIGPIRPSGSGTTIPTSARVAFLAACPAGWTQDGALSGFMLLGTTAAGGDVGQTGGSNDLTPSGRVSTPLFTGDVADNRSAFTKVIWCRVSGSEPAPAVASTWSHVTLVLVGWAVLASALAVVSVRRIPR